MSNVPLKRKIGTSVLKTLGGTDVILYDTVIVHFNDKRIYLNHGGWVTQTTIKRMNQASQEFDLGFHAFRKDGEFWVNFKGENYPSPNGNILTR